MTPKLFLYKVPALLLCKKKMNVTSSAKGTVKGKTDMVYRIE